MIFAFCVSIVLAGFLAGLRLGIDYGRKTWHFDNADDVWVTRRSDLSTTYVPRGKDHD